jgi:hypothetical protein
MLDVLVALDLAQSRVRAQFETGAVGSGDAGRSSRGPRPRFSARRRRAAARVWPEGSARPSGPGKPVAGRS